MSGMAAPTLSASLFTAALTALLGIVVFVLGQIAVKFILDPIQEQARTIGEVTHALTYYANVIEIATPDQKVEAS